MSISIQKSKDRTTDQVIKRVNSSFYLEKQPRDSLFTDGQPDRMVDISCYRFASSLKLQIDEH